MKQNRGFFLLESVIIFTLSTILSLAALRSYQEALTILQKKILLEEAIIIAESGLQPEGDSRFTVACHTQATTITNLNIKEVQILHNDKILFSLAEAE